jgi:hypothetical protein
MLDLLQQPFLGTLTQQHNHAIIATACYFCATWGVVAGQVQPASFIKPLDVPIPALEPGQKPNFIVIVTDDQVRLQSLQHCHTPGIAHRNKQQIIILPDATAAAGTQETFHHTWC